MSENRVPRRIFGRKREEVAGKWRRLHNKELHNLYSSPNYPYSDQINEGLREELVESI
jgi:hypothetical protein